MKKILFAVPALAFTLFLAFCQKADTPETAPVANQNSGATERAVVCDFLLSTNPTNYVYPFIICNTAMNGTTCSMCGTGASGTGQATVYSGNVFQAMSGGRICVTSTNPSATQFMLSNTSGTTGWVNIPANGCVCFIVNDDCTLTPI